MRSSTRLARRGGGDEQPLAEINVTPFVDVVLVLLIIFMITAAVVEFGMRISVPKTTVATSSRPRQFKAVRIASDGRIFFENEVVNLYDIAPRAKQANPDDPSVYVEVHRAAAWERVAQVLAECNAAGIKINLIPRPMRRDPRG